DSRPKHIHARQTRWWQSEGPNPERLQVWCCIPSHKQISDAQNSTKYWLRREVARSKAVQGTPQNQNGSPMLFPAIPDDQRVEIGKLSTLFRPALRTAAPGRRGSADDPTWIRTQLFRSPLGPEAAVP